MQMKVISEGVQRRNEQKRQQMEEQKRGGGGSPGMQQQNGNMSAAQKRMRQNIGDKYGEGTDRYQNVNYPETESEMEEWPKPVDELDIDFPT